jgi:hypothetical protein
MATLTTAGPIAAVKKRWWALSAPIASAASPTSTRYGNITRVSVTARSKSPVSARQPGAMIATTWCESRIPRAETTHRTTMAAPVAARARRAKAAGPPRVRVSVKTGITAVESAPSPRSRRSRFGMRKATRNASVTGPAPKAWATTMSRR